MKTVDIIERIEGEAKLHLTWKNKRVEEAQIAFLNFRGFEYILQNKPILDALVYTPRICGICGQAHLYATVSAIENIYTQAKMPLEITPKAKSLRELGLIIEILQSHIKWFYMFIMPDMNQHSSLFDEKFVPLKGKSWLKAQEASSNIIKALATFAGQWPHTSYMIPGGVVSDPTHMDMIFVENYIDKTIVYFEEEIVGLSLEKYLSFSSYKDLGFINADLKLFIEMSFEQGFENIGKSYNRFLSISDDLGFVQGKIKHKNVMKINLNKIEENADFTFDAEITKQKKEKYTWSKNVKYDQQFYETGPLARALIQNRKFIKAIHKKYSDSVFTRVMARMDEIAFLLQKSKTILGSITISEASFIEPKLQLKQLDSGFGVGVIEATRGSLKHEVVIKNGIIQRYDVITPTVWNLGSGTALEYGVAQKAIIGTKSLHEATIVLRSFDVCSVCTTH
ncbi:MAG: nickel-dependent hydrogenase large subunit [Arcobacteraceae bacterium]